MCWASATTRKLVLKLARSLTLRIAWTGAIGIFPDHGWSFADERRSDVGWLSVHCRLSRSRLGITGMLVAPASTRPISASPSPRTPPRRPSQSALRSPAKASQLVPTGAPRPLSLPSSFSPPSDPPGTHRHFDTQTYTPTFSSVRPLLMNHHTFPGCLPPPRSFAPHLPYPSFPKVPVLAPVRRSSNAHTSC